MQPATNSQATSSHTLGQTPQLTTARPGRAERVEEWFTTPVVVAALASVPAMFLTTLEGHAATVGSGINYATMAVFIAETLVLLVLSGDRLKWLRRHRFAVAVTILSIPAVVFAMGPVQVLRIARMAGALRAIQLVRMVGALRIVRVRRIFKAARILRKRAGLEGRMWQMAALLLSLVAAIFVAVVLADPSSTSRRTLEAAVGRFGLLATLAAGAIVGGATYVVAKSRRSRADEAVETTAEPHDL